MSLEEKLSSPSNTLEEAKSYTEVDRLTFDQIRRGSAILIHVGRTLDEVREQPNYRIEVVGIRKNVLLVRVEPSPFHPALRTFTARIPGGFRGVYPDVPGSSLDYTPGVTPGLIEVATEEIASRLYFENLKDLETGERNARSMTTSPIRKILFKH